MVSGGSGGSRPRDPSFAGGVSACALPVVAAFGVPKMLPLPNGFAAGLTLPNKPPPPPLPTPKAVVLGAVVKNLDGAGVVVGVVDSQIDLGFVGSGSSGVVAPMSSSFDSVLEAPPRDKPPNPLPKRDPPVFAGFSLSLALAGSALKVLPRTKGDEPKAEEPPNVGFEAGNAVCVVSTDAKEPDGFAEPNILPPDGVLPPEPRAANPPLLAKPANPPVDAGAPPALAPPKGVEAAGPFPPKGLAGGVGALEKPDWPQAGVPEPVEAVAQGEDRGPRPIAEA